MQLVTELLSCRISPGEWRNYVAQNAGATGRKCPNARHLKLEDPPLMQKISAILAETDKFEIFGGLGGMFLLEELARGASGTMTGFAFTEILVAVYEAFNAGDKARATEIFDQYLPLIRFENQPGINLTIRKLLLHKRGAIAHPSRVSLSHGWMMAPMPNLTGYWSVWASPTRLPE